MPDVLTEKPGFLCLNCSYPLRGLTGPRCPECGRPFDPTDPTTMNVGRSLSPWCRARLRPPNAWFNGLAVVAGLWLLAAWSGPDAYLLMVLGALGLWLLIGGWWVLRVPTRAAFLVSRLALEARARAMLEAGDSPAMATGPAWIGWFPIASVEREGEAVYFWGAGVGFFDRYGLTYSPSGQWPGESGRTYRSCGRQTWRVCHEDW